MMTGIKPEAITGQSVVIGRRTYPIKQVGEVITKQDRRDFSAEQIARALTQLGFTLRSVSDEVTDAAIAATALGSETVERP